MARLAGKVMLIAGGGADGPPKPGEDLAMGNGRATALACAREGAMVMVADRRLDAAEQTAAAIREAGGEAAAIGCDVTDERQCREAVAITVRTFGALHLLVNNVGIADSTPLTDLDTDTFDRLYAVNVRGHFLMMRHAIPEIAKNGFGSIVNVSSLGALLTGSMPAYETTKAALLGLSRSAVVTAGAHGVRVNTVLPGYIDSAMARKHIGGHSAEATSRIPLGRAGDPAEVAAAIVFLLSDEASYITGTELIVDGGAAAVV